jgi:hypothetical protein
MTNEGAFEKLTIDVDWQLNSLRTYIRDGFIDRRKTPTNMMPSELVVQNVLEAYLCLTEKFYDQFKAQLRKAYDPGNKETTSKGSLSDADVAILLQQALNKLTVEWERVYGFITATKAKKTTETKKLISQLSPMIRAAARDVGFSPESFPVVPHFGMAYNLGFFNYTDDFMALNLPITALQSPWEWTIFWHEIAGHKKRLIKKTEVEFLNALRELFAEMKNQKKLPVQVTYSQEGYPDSASLEAAFKKESKDYLADLLARIVPSYPSEYTEKQTALLEALVDAVYKDWISPDAVNSSLTYTKNLFKDLSPARSNLPILMFSFQDLLDGIMDEIRSQKKKSVTANLRQAFRKSLRMSTNDLDIEDLITAWDEALSLEDDFAAQKRTLDEEGWSVDWLEELFEDSFSVMNFDVNFLPIFDKLLQRYADGGKDMRHPPRYLRLASAAALQMLELDSNLINLAEPPASDKFTDRLDSEQLSILQQYYPGALGETSKAMVWLTAKKFHEMQKRMKIPYEDSDQAVQEAKKKITGAMKAHTDELGTYEGNAKIAREVLAALAAMNSDMSNSEAQNKTVPSNYEKKIESLLNSRNIIGPKSPLGYRELLDLSFYDVDFGTETYTNVQSPWRNMTSAQVMGPPIEVANGPVIYDSGLRKGLRTNKPNWNDKALRDYQIP